MGYLTGKIDVQTKLDPKTDLRSGFDRFTPENMCLAAQGSFAPHVTGRSGIFGESVQSAAQLCETRHQREIAVLVATLGADQRGQAALVARRPRV